MTIPISNQTCYFVYFSLRFQSHALSLESRGLVHPSHLVMQPFDLKIRIKFIKIVRRERGWVEFDEIYFVCYTTIILFKTKYEKTTTPFGAV